MWLKDYLEETWRKFEVNGEENLRLTERENVEWSFECAQKEMKGKMNFWMDVFNLYVVKLGRVEGCCIQPGPSQI
jgi:hypothetical protein